MEYFCLGGQQQQSSEIWSTCNMPRHQDKSFPWAILYTFQINLGPLRVSCSSLPEILTRREKKEKMEKQSMTFITKKGYVGWGSLGQ